MSRRISSIASAPGWKARFLAEDEMDGARVVTLVAWALVEASDRMTEIVGVVQRLPTVEAPDAWFGFADEIEGFQGYTFTGLVTQGPGDD